MKSILNDLYYGRISPWERRPVRTPKHKEIERNIETEKRYFIGKMSLDDCERFTRLESLYSEASSLDEVDAFSYGFRLATMLMCAVFLEENEPMQIME